MDKTSPIIIVILTVLLGVMIFLYFTKETAAPDPFPGQAQENRFGPGNEEGGPKGRAPQERGKQILKELNLTAEQESKINELRQRDEETMRANKQAIENAKRKMESAINNPATSEEELRTLSNELEKARSEMKTARFDHMMAIRDLLTPEQRKKFTELQGPRPKNPRGHVTQ